nr:unnamed protein product [Trichobilharzia regenti]
MQSFLHLLRQTSMNHTLSTVFILLSNCQSIDQEINILREQKENAICECAKLKTQLEQKECTLKQLREKVEEMQVLNKKHDNQLREQMRSVLMNLQIEQAATKDASLEIERLNVQLHVSK